MNRSNYYLKRIFDIRIWGYGLFWSWNLIFLAFMFLGFAPNVLPETLRSIQNDLIPLRYLASVILVTLIPLFAVLLGLTLLRRSPGKLLTLGYGVEGPLMVLLLVRIFAIRDATTAINLLYLCSAVGVFTLFWQLLDKRIDERGLIFDIVRVVGLTVLFLLGIYAGVLIAFYVIPLLKEIPQFFVDMARQFWRYILEAEWKSLIMLPFSLLGILLGGFTATLFIAAPIATASSGFTL